MFQESNIWFRNSDTSAIASGDGPPPGFSSCPVILRASMVYCATVLSFGFWVLPRISVLKLAELLLSGRMDTQLLGLE